MAVRFTPKQGQYLTFIYYFTKVNGRAPAQVDLQRYFRVTPPAVHDMILRLSAEGLLERQAGVGRSYRVLVPREELPELE